MPLYRIALLQIIVPHQQTCPPCPAGVRSRRTNLAWPVSGSMGCRLQYSRDVSTPSSHFPGVRRWNHQQGISSARTGWQRQREQRGTPNYRPTLPHAHPAPRQNRPATRARQLPSPVQAAGWMAGTAGARPAGSAGMARAPHPCCRAPRPAHTTCKCVACCRGGRASGGREGSDSEGACRHMGCLVRENSRAGQQQCTAAEAVERNRPSQQRHTRQTGCLGPLERIWGGSAGRTRRGCTCVKQCSFPSGPG